MALAIRHENSLFKGLFWLYESEMIPVPIAGKQHKQRQASKCSARGM